MCVFIYLFIFLGFCTLWGRAVCQIEVAWKEEEYKDQILKGERRKAWGGFVMERNAESADMAEKQ